MCCSGTDVEGRAAVAVAEAPSSCGRSSSSFGSRIGLLLLACGLMAAVGCLSASNKRAAPAPATRKLQATAAGIGLPVVAAAQPRGTIVASAGESMDSKQDLEQLGELYRSLVQAEKKRKPTKKPTKRPRKRTKKPSRKPTKKPTRKPTKKRSRKPTRKPTKKPTKKPTQRPTKKPTKRPTKKRSRKPTRRPTRKPTKRHTKKHTKKHTRKPTKRPTKKPTKKRTDTTGPKRPGGKPLQIGVAAHMGLNQFEDDYRSNIDAWVKFTDVNEDMQWDTYIQPVLDQGKEVVLVTQFYPTDGSFDNLNAIAYYGQYDDRINSLADTLLAKGNPSNVWLRPLHEMNGDWYPWGVFSGGNNADAFKNAYRHIHDILKGRGVNAKFQLAYNCRTPDQFSYTSFGDLYPGSDYVDMIVCSGYNRAGTPNNNSWVTLKDFFSGAYDDMAGLSDTVPIGIGETGSTNYYGGNSRADWIRDAFHDIFYDFPRVEQVDWFFIDKSPESGDWELNTSEEIDAFSDGCRDYSS